MVSRPDCWTLSGKQQRRCLFSFSPIQGRVHIQTEHIDLQVALKVNGIGECFHHRSPSNSPALIILHTGYINHSLFWKSLARASSEDKDSAVTLEY